MIKIIYDNKADAAYIYFSKYPEGRTEKTYLCDPKAINGMINLDFTDNKLVGIEVMDASWKLPGKCLKDERAKFEYNKETNVAFVVFTNADEIKKVYECETLEYGGIIKLNFNDDNRLIRVEINNASDVLKEEVFISFCGLFIKYILNKVIRLFKR